MAETCPIPLRRVLLPTDGSDFSEGAVREGLRLAKSCGSKLTALYVIEFNPEFEALSPSLAEKAEVRAHEYMMSLKDRAQKEAIDCQTLIRRSETPYSQIVKEAQDLNADVIVMGRRGRTGIKRLMMGSVTARVIGHSPVDVLVVPRAASILFKNILVAVDGSRFSDEAASHAIGIAKTCGANLIAISVMSSEAAPFVYSEMQKTLIENAELKEAQEAVKHVKESALREGVKVEGIVMGGRPYEVIVETAEGKRADLIVIGSHGRTGIERLLMGSVAERVIGHAHCATWVAKAKAKA